MHSELQLFLAFAELVTATHEHPYQQVLDLFPRFRQINALSFFKAHEGLFVNVNNHVA